MCFKPLALNLPEVSLKLSKKNGKLYVFDDIRKKYLLLTPEEWVRQHFINYLIHTILVPKSLIGVENGLVLNEQARRSDILVFNTYGEGLMMVECKAPSVRLSQEVMDQIVRYNMVRNCKWLVLTNGLQHIYAQVVNNEVKFYKELPTYLNL